MWSKTSLFQEGCSKVPAQIQDRNRYSECKWPPPPTRTQPRPKHRGWFVDQWQCRNSQVHPLLLVPAGKHHHPPWFFKLEKASKTQTKKKSVDTVQCRNMRARVFVYTCLCNDSKFTKISCQCLMTSFSRLWHTLNLKMLEISSASSPTSPHPRTSTWQLITVWQSFGSTDTVRPVPQARLVGKVLVLRHETAICTIQHQTNSWYILPFWKNWSIWSGRIFDFLIQLQNFRWSTSQPNPVSQPFAQECNFKNTLLWNPADKLTTP